MMEHTQDATPPNKQRKIRIWQQNLNKSATAQQHFLHNLNPTTYDIAVIQEPAINRTNLTTANSKWNIVYPTMHNKTNAKRTRSVLFINKKISKDGWHIIPIESPDITAIELINEEGNICIYNIYNNGNHQDTLTLLAHHLGTQHSTTNITAGLILLGDFNCHHPLWNDPNNHHLFTNTNIAAAQPLLDILATHNLRMPLPPGTPTLHANASKNYTRPDNVFSSESLMATIIRCEVVEQLTPVNTDHFPIITECIITPELMKLTPRYNFCMTDWDKFDAKLQHHLQQLPRPKPICSIHTAENRLKHLNKAIKETIQEIVPKTKPSPFAKRWWSHDLEQENKHLKHLTRTAKAKCHMQDHPVHQEHKAARKAFAKQIEQVKLDHWTEYLEEVDAHNIWGTHKYLKDDPSDHFLSRIPNLRKPGTDQPPPLQTNDEKSKLLFETFFKPPQDEREDMRVC